MQQTFMGEYSKCGEQQEHLNGKEEFWRRQMQVIGCAWCLPEKSYWEKKNAQVKIISSLKYHAKSSVRIET